MIQVTITSSIMRIPDWGNQLQPYHMAVFRRPQYILLPRGPYDYQGNTLRLRIGEKQYGALSCHAAECTAIRTTFHGGNELDLGQMFQDYWATKRLSYPKIVAIKLPLPQNDGEK
jgi:hypothetical protein